MDAAKCILPGIFAVIGSFAAAFDGGSENVDFGADAFGVSEEGASRRAGHAEEAHSLPKDDGQGLGDVCVAVD